jgi:hypothetical protein
LTEETGNSVLVYPLDGGSPTMICGSCGGRGSDEPELVSWSPDGKFLYITIWRQPAFAIPLRAGQVLPPLPPKGIQSSEDLMALPGAKPFPVPGAFPASDPSVYAYARLAAQRNIFDRPSRHE